MKTLTSILLDLIPIGLAMIVRPIPVGIGMGLLFAAVYLGIQVRSRKATIKTVSVVNVVYLAVAFLVPWLKPDTSVLNYAQLSIYLILTVSTLLSLVVGEPFTMQYAKQEVARSLWENPIFIRINRRLTQLWASLFSLSLFFAVLAVFHVLPEVWGVILVNGWNLLGIVAMMILPARMQRFYLTQLYKPEPKEAQWKPEYPVQRPTNPRQYDVIVVGAGIGGLVTAVEVAKRGAKVLVLDQHYLPGGVCTTYERKGFKFDAGVESVSGLGKSGPVTHFLRRHGLDNALVWTRNVYEIRTPEFQMVIPNDFEEWRDKLVRMFPDEEEGIHAVFAEIQLMYREKLSVFAPDRIVPNRPKTPETMLAFAENNPHYVRWQHTRWGEFLHHFISHPSLHRLLSMLTGYVGDDGANTPTDIMVSLMGYFIDGGYHPLGGSGELAKTLVQKLKEYGGEIRLSSRGDSILIEGGRVRGVVSKTGTDFSPVVVSNVDPRVTYETLIGLDKVSEEERVRIQALQPSMSLFVWNAALNRPFPNRNLLFCDFATPKTLPQWGLSFRHAGIHSAAAIDPTLAPEGKGTITINLATRAEASRLKAMTKETYKALKDDIDRLCRDIIREVDGQAVNQILFSEVATPKTFARYLNTYEGSIYNIKRKSTDDFPHMKSSIQGLFLVGAGTGYGPGIEAVIITGSEVADKMDVPVRKEAVAGSGTSES